MTMRHFLPTLLAICLAANLQAQLGSNLVTYLSFEQDSLFDDSGYGNLILLTGDTLFACGAQGKSLRFDGLQNSLRLTGDISSNRIRSTNFSVSFYFRPGTGSGVYDIVSKREECDEDKALAITYTPQGRQLSVLVSENANNQVKLTHTLPGNRCWFHVVVIRRANKVILYIDGKFVKEALSPTRVNLNNGAALSLSGGPCLGQGQVRFQGDIDEFRVYDRDITEADIDRLFEARDVILTRDTVVYKAQPVDIRTSGSCATSFSWTPTQFVTDPTAMEPRIFPEQSGRYQVSFFQEGCTAIDTVFIEVVDPDSLDCNRLLLPDAFTPNGDNLNDVFGISNPIALEAVESFRIFDRWGGRIFETTDAYGTWDGNFEGQQAMPGIYIYRIVYRCQGETFDRTGSFSLIR